MLVYRTGRDDTNKNKTMINERELTKEEVLQIPELITEKKTFKEIAITFGVHENTIKSWVRKLRKAGYKIKTKRGRMGMLEKLENNKETK